MRMQATTTTPLFAATLRPDRSLRLAGGWVAFAIAFVVAVPFLLAVEGFLLPGLVAFVAAGAALGTRFVATRESRAHPEYKAALVAAAGAGDTVLTLCFDGGWSQAAHRVLRNATLEAWEAYGCPAPGPQRPGEGEVLARAASSEPILRYADTAPRAGMTGRIAEMCLYAGTGVGAVTGIPPAAEVVARLAAEAGLNEPGR